MAVHNHYKRIQHASLKGFVSRIIPIFMLSSYHIMHFLWIGQKHVLLSASFEVIIPYILGYLLLVIMFHPMLI